MNTLHKTRYTSKNKSAQTGTNSEYSNMRILIKDLRCQSDFWGVLWWEKQRRDIRRHLPSGGSADKDKEMYITSVRWRRPPGCSCCSTNSCIFFSPCSSSLLRPRCPGPLDPSVHLFTAASHQPLTFCIYFSQHHHSDVVKEKNPSGRTVSNLLCLGV